MFSAEEIALTEDYDAVDLAKAIAQRKYTAVTVATAFSTSHNMSSNQRLLDSVAP